jgi:probable HAF family extracellular repeat protein
LHAYITSSNHVFASDLGTLGGYTSFANAVNDSGQVAGYSEVTRAVLSPVHAFITDINSNMMDLGTLGGQSSEALDINSNGVVVGWAETTIANRRHAFITGPDGNGMTDLNSLVELQNGTFLADATGINDRGQIIANASDGHAYLLTPLLTPVPEPETYAMLLAGLALMGLIVRRRRLLIG